MMERMMAKRNSRLKLRFWGAQGSGLLTHVDTGKVYQPNGKRECARRARQQAKINQRSAA